MAPERTEAHMRRGTRGAIGLVAATLVVAGAVRLGSQEVADDAAEVATKQRRPTAGKKRTERFLDGV